MKKINEPVSKFASINIISVLIVELSTHLEKIVNKKLFVNIFGKELPEPFWRIAKDEKMYGIICTIHYYPLKKELSFWCTHENCINTNIYRELSRKLEESAQKLGLSIKDLNPIKTTN